MLASLIGLIVASGSISGGTWVDSPGVNYYDTELAVKSYFSCNCHAFELTIGCDAGASADIGAGCLIVQAYLVVDTDSFHYGSDNRSSCGT